MRYRWCSHQSRPKLKRSHFLLSSQKVGMSGQSAWVSVDLTPFVVVLKDLLNFEQCLDPAGRCFGPFRVLFSQVFYESSSSFALVNLKPIVPGLYWGYGNLWLS